jgi:hypothetical protein
MRHRKLKVQAEVEISPIGCRWTGRHWCPSTGIGIAEAPQLPARVATRARPALKL